MKGNLLLTQLDGSFLDIETFGASKISISYDTHELVSKTGKIWTFTTGNQIIFHFHYQKIQS